MPADLPLREQRPIVDERRPVVERDLFRSAEARTEADAAWQPPSDDDAGGGVTIGISIWVVAAVALVAGIIIGFASGFTAGQRAVSFVPPVETVFDEPRPAPAAPPPAPPAFSRTFTEGAVTEPVRVDPPPIVPAEPLPAVSAPEPPPVVPAPRPVEGAPRARRAAPVEPVASGPGSLQIVSRPSGAQVVVDGRVVGRTPLVLADVRSGSHDVRIELAGFRRWATSVNVTSGTRTRVAASLEQ